MNVSKIISAILGRLTVAGLGLICLLAFGGQIAGQSNSAVTIRVADANGALVQGATVTLSGRSLLSRTAVTDPTGTVTFESVPSGELRVSVQANGFAAANRTVDLAAGRTSFDIALSTGPVSETVTVTAERTQVTSIETAKPITVVGREEIEQKGINTIGDVFRTLPGTSTVNEGAFQVRPRIRGLDSNRVLILVDGERLNNSRTSTGQSGIELGLVETSQIQSVEVVRGSGSVLYGTDALAGTINIITKDTPPKREAGFRFGAALDTFYTSNENGRRGNLSLNGSGNRFAFRVAQSLERFGNYSTGDADANFLAGQREGLVDITDDGEVLNSQSHGSNSSATVRFFLNDNNTIRANYDRRRAGNVGSPGLEGTIGFFNAFFPFSNRDKVSGRWDSAALTENLQRLSVSGFYQTQYRNFTTILNLPPAACFCPGMYQFGETVTDTKTVGFDAQSDWALGSRNNLVAGISYFQDDNSDRRLQVTAARPWSVNRTYSNAKSVPDSSLWNFAAFAQDEFRVTKRLKLIGGVRVDKFKTTSEATTGFALPPLQASHIEDLGIANLATGLDVSNTAVTGDFGAVYRVTNSVSVSGRLGRSFRTPNIFELFFTGPGSIGGRVVGNPNLEPETGFNVDTSVKVRTNRFSASATYFNNSYKNFLQTLPAVDRNRNAIFLNQPGPAVRVYQTQNIERARIQGFEAEFDAPFKISLGYLTPYGNFSYLHGDNTATDQPLNFISPFRTNVGVRWQNLGKAYFFDYNSRIVGKQERLTADFLQQPTSQGGNGGPEAGFVTHNVSGGYYFRRERFNLGINLGVSNIFDRAYSEQFVFAPARGRSFTIGTTWEIK